MVTHIAHLPLLKKNNAISFSYRRQSMRDHYDQSPLRGIA
jgi:hypothetical protein